MHPLQKRQSTMEVLIHSKGNSKKLWWEFLTTEIKWRWLSAQEEEKTASSWGKCWHLCWNSWKFTVIFKQNPFAEFLTILCLIILFKADAVFSRQNKESLSVPSQLLLLQKAKVTQGLVNRSLASITVKLDWNRNFSLY